MSESFFQSIEFANLLDVVVLLVALLVGPILWSALARITRRQAALMLSGYAAIVLSLSLATYRTGYILFSQFPVAPSVIHYASVFMEAVAFWLMASFIFAWRGAQRTRTFFLVSGLLTLVAGVTAGLGGWRRNALLAGTFQFRPEAEYIFIAIKLAMVFSLLVWLLRRNKQDTRLILFAAVLVTFRESSQFLLVGEGPLALRTALELYTHLSLAGAMVVGALEIGDIEAAGVRARAFRTLIFGFVTLSTVVVALSFNYLLRDRLLDEAFGRYRGEAEKIGNDVSAYLKRLERQVRALAAPELYETLAGSGRRAEALASLPTELLLEDFRSVSFFSADGALRQTYTAADSRPSPPVLGSLEREGLWASRTGTLTLARNFTTHGSLFYELDGLSRIRSDRPENQPELVFVAGLRSATGEPLGYIEAVYPTQRLKRFFAGYGAETGWDFLATSDGLLLAHGSPDYAGYDLSRFHEIFEGSDSLQRWHRINLPGGSSYLVISRMSDRDWVVGRVLSTQTMLGALRKLRDETLSILIITLSVTTFIALILAGFVNRQRMALERMELELEHKAQIEAKNVELSVERQKVETILLSIGEGVIVCDAAGSIVFVNAIAERMLRISGEKLMGQPASALNLEGLDTALAEAQRAFRNSGAGAGFEEFVVAVGGLDLRGNVAPLVREGEAYQGAVIILQDISELMKLDRLKTEIISIVSHSLRTPLTSIKSFTEILQDKAGELPPEKEREYLEIIDFSTDRLTRIVNNILDLSKIAGGKMSYNFRSTDLGELLQESTVVASGAAQAKKIELVTRWNGHVAELGLDRAKMMQVFDNLLGNAIKFTPHGGHIEVSLKETGAAEIEQVHGRRGLQPGGNYALIEVKDNGVGISVGNLERIFDQFFQDDYVRHSNEGGTGLGLAISKEYVVAHGGQIWAESEPGKGSSFFVALPL